MTTIRQLIIIICATFPTLVKSQNLVTNPGFENYINDKIIGWESTAWSPDFYNALVDKKKFENVHCGASIGNGFLGISLMGEVASTKLLSKLDPNQEYLIKIFVQKPITFCQGGVKKITVAFTGGQLARKDGRESSFYPVPYLTLYPSDFKPLKEKCKWVEFSAIYKAQGTESYLHIGDFRNDKNRNNQANKEIVFVDSLESSSQCTYIHYDSVSVTKLSTGKDNSIVIPGILFENNKSNLLPTSNVALDNLYGLIYRFKNYKINIVGYTDNVGNKNDNLTLSKSRADAVVNYLVKKGIPKTKLHSLGQGDAKPIADNSTEEGRAKNRRVEIELTK